jgi:hypothetical protein
MARSNGMPGVRIIAMNPPASARAALAAILHDCISKEAGGLSAASTTSTPLTSWPSINSVQPSRTDTPRATDLPEESAKAFLVQLYREL